MNILKKSMTLLTVGFMTGAMSLSPALAAVIVQSGPTALFASTQIVPANSQPLGLFSMNLNQNAGETLSSVTVHVNNIAPAAVESSHIANVSVYKDNGDGIFNPATDLLAGSQTTVNINADTVITTASNNAINASGGMFFVSLQTSGTWTSVGIPDAITVTFPASGIVVGNPTSTLTVTPITSPLIQADTVGPMLTSVVAQDTAVTSTKTVGDTLVFNFNEATNKPAVTTANVDSVLTVNNGHMLKDVAGNLGSTVWNSNGTSLTLTLNNDGSGVPTVAVGDIVTAMTPIITDGLGNTATSTATITGSFGGLFASTVATHVQNASNTDITNTNVLLGTAVHDNATVTGVTSTTTPTGTARFALYNNGTCTGTVLSTELATLVNGNASSSATSTLAIGSYSYGVSYAGDQNFATSVASCEPFTVQQSITPPPTTTGCTNGLINGKLYMVQGSTKVYLAAACVLKPFKGKAVRHAKGKKFQNIITLPASDLDANGHLIASLTTNPKPRTHISEGTEQGEENHTTIGQGKVNQYSITIPNQGGKGNKNGAHSNNSNGKGRGRGDGK